MNSTKKPPVNAVKTQSVVSHQDRISQPAVYRPMPVPKCLQPMMAKQQLQSQVKPNNNVTNAATTSLQPKMAESGVIQLGKKPKPIEPEVIWRNYTCYETSAASQIESRMIARYGSVSKAKSEIHRLIRNKNLPFPGHCSAGPGSNKNNATPGKCDDIRNAFYKHLGIETRKSKQIKQSTNQGATARKKGRR